MAGEADYRLLTEATGQRIATALESLVNLGDPVTIAHGGTGASTAAAALAALGGVAVTDIVDNLTSTATDKPLSANMGKTLKELVEPLTDQNKAWMSSVDLDTFNITGFYPVSTNLAHAPGQWGIVFVIAARRDTIEQFYFGTIGIMWRECRSGTWSEWVPLLYTPSNV